MGSIHFFGGEKGGVGKSFVCRAAVAYHQRKELPFVVYDADRTSPDVYRIHSDIAKRVVLSEARQFENSPAAIIDDALDKTVLVNLPAQSFIALRDWFERDGLFEIGKVNQIKYKFWFVTNAGLDSLKIFQASLKYFEGRATHVLVKNNGMNNDWEPIDGDLVLQKLISDHRVSVLDFPRFIGSRDRNLIKQRSLGFLEAEEFSDLGLVGRQRVINFMRAATKEFDRARVFRYDKHAIES